MLECDSTWRWPMRMHGLLAEKTLRATSGKIIAVFKRSFYLQTADGLACIGPLSLGAGPLNALAQLPQDMDWQASGLQLNTQVQRAGDRLFVGAFSFCLYPSDLWQAPDREPVNPILLQRGLSALKNHMLGGKPSLSGLRSMIPALISGVFKPALTADTATALIGMGQGLTPSGDDFVAGLLIGLRYLGQDPQADRLASYVLAKAKSHTNLISYHHLAAAAQGLAGAAIHNMMSALCRGQTCLNAEIDAISAIGHSSGWDMLAGLVFALAHHQS